MTTKKPSEQVSEHFNRIKDTAVTEARFIVEAGRGVFTAEAEAAALQSAYNFAITRYLDAEHERCAAFEKDVTERLAKLEELAKPLRYVIAPKNTSQADFAKLVDVSKGFGALVLPHGVEVSGPTVELYEPDPVEPEPESEQK